MNVPFDKPKNFGPFELLEKIGRGGTAIVYKARQKSDGRIVAVKMGARMLALDEANFARFKREFTIIQHLSHPNLIEALEFGEDKNVPFLVLEYVEGESLEQRLKIKGPMPLIETAEIILQIAEGLDFLHKNQILHRDIKPGNVLITPQGVAKLGDFGLLKTLADETGMTGNRQAMGTVEFGAPEQFEDARTSDFRCDVYSLAATLYSALTGFFPFGSGSMRRILQRKQKNKYVPLRKIYPSMPPELDELIARSIHADRERRPKSIAEFSDTLTEIATSHGAVASTFAAPAMPTDLDSSKTGAERRTAARVSVALPAAFVPFHQNKRSSFRATIVDVSPGGLCLQTNSPTPMNTLVEVTAVESGDTYIAQVRWVKTIAADDFIVGCSFACPPETHEIVAIHPPVR